MAFRRSPLSIVAVSLSVLVVSCEERPSTPEPGIPDEPDGSVAPAALPLTLPDDPIRLRNLGKLHAERDTEEGYRHAVLYLRRLVERQEGTATDRLSLAKALLFSAQLDDCEKFLAEARKGFGTQRAPADLDYVAGLLAKRGRRFEEAARHFARVIEKRPGHLHALFQLGYMQEELQRFEEAEKSFRRVLVGHPEHRASTYRLAVVLRNLKKQDEAAAMLERFRSFPKSKGGDGEKCDLTAVTMRPGDRASSEPPRVSLSWRDVTASVLASRACR